MGEGIVRRWLPVGFNFTRTAASVGWLDFGGKDLSEPFFNQTLKQLRSIRPKVDERSTSITELLEAGAAVPAISPAGIIFHVSRCGSTALTNALKTGEGCSALSEAHPIGMLFQDKLFEDSPFPSESREEVRKLLLDAVIRLYAAAYGPRLIIKCQAVPILYIERIRSIWPKTPFVVMIRNPVEVMVSNLDRSSGWMRSMQRPMNTINLFGWTRTQVRQMTVEEYCARGLGRFLDAAADQLDQNCYVLDYEDLTFSNICKVFRLFDIKMPGVDSSEFQQALRSYSKDLGREREFENDCERKQREATASLQELALRWAQQPYDRLRRGTPFDLSVL